MKISRGGLAAVAMLSSVVAHAQYSQPTSQPPMTDQSMTPPRQDQQQAGQEGPATAGDRRYNLSRGERSALAPALAAVGTSDWPAVQAALPAAVEAARSADAKYIIGQIRLRMGIALNDRAIQAQAVDELIASGGAQPGEMRGLYENQLDFATAAGDTAKAARAQAALDAMNPNDPDRFIRQARIRASANDAAGAIALYRQAMQQAQSAGRPIPPEWRQQIAALAYSARLPETNTILREMVTASPSPATWHDALAILAESSNANSALKLDIYRLVRAAGAMQAERDYIELGEAANEARNVGETHAVYQEGLRRNLITVNSEIARQRLQVASGRLSEDRASLAGERAAALSGSDGRAVLRLADAYYGYGEYGTAAELYRAALAKGGVDAATVNTRLGAALAQSGDRAGAEAAFRAVGSAGTRGELAQYWLLWLSQRS